jgi:protein-glutamine gamma-glutamyltransferase
MPPVRVFRTSLYLSLAIAVSAIGVAGGDLLPEIPFVTAFCLLLLGLAYVLEGRFELSLRDANLVGLFLFALLGLWAIFQAVRPPTGLMDTLPWPASALPYLAPVLMLLIPAKMLRPKHVGDYWAMHGLGLLAMALACAMASEGAFIFIFILYAITFVWSLVTFYVYRELGPELAGTALPGSRWRAARPAILWATIAGSVAVPLFWATPRSGSQWELGINTRGRATTGIGDGPDLNTVGTLTVNKERAFEVRVEDVAGNPVTELPADQRWRVQTLHNYDGGRWVRNQFGFQTIDRARSPVATSSDPREKLPDLGPHAIYLSFTVDGKITPRPPLADPVAWRSGQLAPAVSRLSDRTYRSWIHRHDGTFEGAGNLDNARSEYVQVWVPPAKPGLGPVMRVKPADLDQLVRYRGLTRLKKFTDQLVERLVGEGRLPLAVLTDVDKLNLSRAPQHHEAIARALEAHLSSSGEFTYTLDLERKDKAIDPCEDFVLNTKAGHCQRFATALVLMLRSQGIPSQMVVGYRGCESRGDGWYDVREDHAHAWVEVLVQSADDDTPPLWQLAPQLGVAAQVDATSLWAGSIAPAWFSLLRDTGLVPMRWITLDPTPGEAGADDSGATSLLGQARQRWEAILKALLLAYNKESREQAAEAVAYWLTDQNGGFYLAAGALGLVGLRYGVRRRARRRAAGAAMPTSVRRLTAILARAGYPWPPGQTAREYARSAGAGLKLVAATAGVAHVPERVVAAYYAERFGQVRLTDAEVQQLDVDLRALQAAL